MNANAKKICNEHKAKSDNCRQTCPLAKACDYHPKDTQDRYNIRMDAAADALVAGAEPETENPDCYTMYDTPEGVE